ncbi:hypothetical protein [Actinomadura harenae]|uniref:Uncharacterized protein n=1 Tax=Actinomadura harenae TaxID=2483351 RepID=A0A3M2LSI7_9ACTN|nr:hypothetical protein [Actinomadura harenae]RMI40441.1 hypothetical protein EBO15_26660 [Actinomadura harenae]
MTAVRGVFSGAARVVVLGALAACLALPLAPQKASACDVGYGYRPRLELGKPHLGRGGTCSTGTSSVGVLLVTVVVLGGLAAAGSAVVRRGASRLPGPPGRDQALTDYLQATGLVTPSSPPSGPGRGN